MNASKNQLEWFDLCAAYRKFRHHPATMRFYEILASLPKTDEWAKHRMVWTQFNTLCRKATSEIPNISIRCHHKFVSHFSATRDFLSVLLSSGSRWVTWTILSLEIQHPAQVLEKPEAIHQSAIHDYSHVGPYLCFPPLSFLGTRILDYGYRSLVNSIIASHVTKEKGGGGGLVDEHSDQEILVFWYDKCKHNTEYVLIKLGTSRDPSTQAVSPGQSAPVSFPPSMLRGIHPASSSYVSRCLLVLDTEILQLALF